MSNEILTTVQLLEKNCQSEAKKLKKQLTDKETISECFQEPKSIDVSTITTSDDLGISKDTPGIYIFILKNNITLNKKHNTTKGEGENEHKIAKIKNNAIDGTHEIGTCFYLGKSHNLSKRLSEHIISASRSTYALKLFLSSRKELKEHLTLYYFPLKQKYLDYKEGILPIVEKQLHQLLTPLAGSSRP